MLDIAAFCRKNPVLYHVAAEGAWPQIERHGLLSTEALFDFYNVDQSARLAIASIRRSRSYVLSHRLLGEVTIRDQVPLNLKVLSNVLDGMAVPQWQALLNCRVFFFPTLLGAQALMHSRLNRDKTCLLVEADTSEIFGAYAGQIEVADINTGTAMRAAPKRGQYTFQSPACFQKVRHRQILEVTVLGTIPDFRKFVRRAIHRSSSSGHQEVVFTRP